MTGILTHSRADLARVQADAALDNSPLWFGEWGLPTQFNATDEFLKTWADAQKYIYGQDKGWIVRAALLDTRYVALIWSSSSVVLELQARALRGHRALL